jgi:hypothetical protein
MRQKRLSLIFFLLALTSGCADDPTRPSDGPSRIFFQPPPGAIEIEPFTQVLFKAIHGVEGELPAKFYVDDQLVHEGPYYLYTLTFPGQHRLRIDASASDEARSAIWRIHVVDEVSTPTPMPAQMRLERMSTSGALNAEWEGPPASRIQVPVEAYLLHYAFAPFYDTADAGVQHVEIPPDPTRIVQTKLLLNLTESLVVYARVQVRDVLGRKSPLTDWDAETVGAEFRIYGTMRALDTGALRWSLLGGGKASWRDSSALSDVNGLYELTGLSDFYQAEIFATHPGGQYHGLRTLALPSENQVLNLFFLPLEDHAMRVSDAEPEAVDLSRLLRIFSRTEAGTTGAAKKIYRWEEYPVQLFVPEFVHEGDGGELVDYRAVFTGAVDRWNQAAGRPMFEMVLEDVAVGATYSATLSGPNAPLGEVVIVDPPNSSLFLEPPLKMLVKLRQFNSMRAAELIITHELGHVLLLGHSPDSEHCMYGSPSTEVPSALEGYVARLLSVMPQGLDMNLHREN